ncbi:hypothetical protein ACF0H5_000295 [Mactra antiquata]
MAPSMEAIAQSLVHLSQEKNPATREQLLRTGLNEMVKWFTLAAQIILQKKVQLPKQTLNFMEKHRHELEQLQDDNIDLDTKRQLILKPGGSGFLGGVMIRSLLRWNGKKTIRKFGPKKTAKKTAKKTSKKTTKKRKAYVAHKTPVSSPQSLHERSSRHSSTPSTPRQSSRHSSTPSTPRQSSRHSTPIHSTPRRSSRHSSTPRRSSRHSTPIHSTPTRSSRSSPFSGVNFTPIHSTPNSSRRTSSSRRSLTDSSSHISTRPYSFTGSSTPRTPKSTSSLSPPARFSPLHIDSDMVKQELMRQGLRRMDPTSATPVDKMQDLVRRGVRRLLSQPRTGDASMNDTLNALEWLYK